SKFCAGRFARPLLFVDVLLFSFQGSSLIAALIGDFINIPYFNFSVNTISKYFFWVVLRTYININRHERKIKPFFLKRTF
ncbi:hypothetical protein, partial [uncultured Planococcus sp.]|uniref:hypothetical protein n=1 Tax=uncultured Planococcus sp. TaxID=337815 RepID=UPI002612908C